MTLAVTLPASASDTKDLKLEIPKNNLSSKVSLEQIKESLTKKFSYFGQDIVFPDFLFGPGCDIDTSIPEIKPPQEDVQKPETSIPESPDKPTEKPDIENVTPPTSKPDTSLPETDDIPQTESSLNEYEREVIKLVNEIRAENGLALLDIDEELSRVARIKSQDMKDNNYFSHTSPTYGSPFDMMDKFGITYKSAGENIAKGQSTPQEVVNAWMNSQGHRKNILKSSYTSIGVGYVANGNYWTQMFIGK